MNDAPARDSEQVIRQLRDELARVEAERARLERERDRLRRENERVRKELDAARRAGFRQAAPFSKGAPVARPRRPGRKPGRAYGRQGRRAVPPVIDETYDVPLPGTCPECGAGIEDTHVIVQYQEDLPPVRPRVRRFDIHVGRCRGCGQRSAKNVVDVRHLDRLVVMQRRINESQRPLLYMYGQRRALLRAAPARYMCA